MAAELRSGDRVLYFYGVTQSLPSAAISQPGVDLQSIVEPIANEHLVCWISRVSAEEFESGLARNMENLDWLATASVAHQRAIAAIAQQLDILPARFGTVFRSEQSLRKHIREHLAEIESDFRRIKDADEWGVKVFANPPAATPPASSGVRTGTDYLKAKAALRPRRTSASGNGDYSEFESALSQVAVASAPAGKVSSGQRGLRFQASLLVKRKDRAKFESVLKKFSQRWAESQQIECTGPWPPYSFVSREQRTTQR